MCIRDRYNSVLVMLPTGRCRNCSVPTQNLLCNTCWNYIQCNRCYRYLPSLLYHNDDVICNACQNGDAHNVGRYAHDRLIGDRTLTGTWNDMSQWFRSTYRWWCYVNIRECCSWEHCYKVLFGNDRRLSTDNTRWIYSKYISQVFHTDNNIRCGELSH